ncbi:B12-binding domain-containing radical SAM protein [Acidobacteriota bacterium]
MKKKRVLLLNPPGDKLYIRDYYCSFSSKADYYWPPQDLIYLSGILDQDFSVQVVDAIINRLSEEQVLDIVLSSEPDAVLFTTGTATMKSDLRLMERIKGKKDIRIVASAGILKFLGSEFLEKYPVVDAMLLDFTEQNIVPYLLDQGSGPVRGLLFRENGRFVASDEKPGARFQVPIPRHDLFDFHKYRIPIAKRFPFTVVVTSLGCPYSCGFCAAGAFGYRTRDVDGVIAELKVLAGLGVKEILFQDPTFTINTNRVVEICQKMVDQDLDLTWSCNGDIKSLNEEKIKHMKMAGCHTVSLGIESGSDEILEKYSKMITTQEIKDMIRLLNGYKIRVLGYFIIGLPGDDRESIRETIDLAKQLDIDIASFAIATPDIGTPLRQEALKKGWMGTESDIFDSTDFPVIETETLRKEDVWEMRSRAVKEFYLRPSYLFKKICQIRSLRDVKVAMTNAISLFRKS